MKVRLNEDKEVVARIKEGLKRTGGYCPCRLARTEENKCMCKEFRNQIKDPDFEGYCHCMLYYKEKYAPARRPRCGCRADLLRADRVVRPCWPTKRQGLFSRSNRLSSPGSPFAMILAKRKSAFGVMEPNSSFASGSMARRLSLSPGRL